MNSIRRPRGRPRTDSVNFSTFFWVLRREAVLRVVFRTHVGSRFELHARREAARGTTDHAMRAAWRVIDYTPSRRFFPCPNPLHPFGSLTRCGACPTSSSPGSATMWPSNSRPATWSTGAR